MPSWSDYAGLGVTAAGAVAAPFTAGISGMVAPAISSGLSLLDKSKQAKHPGVSPEMEKSLFYSSELARRSMELDGISALEASRVSQAGNQESLNTLAEANTLSRRMSPLDRQKLTQALMEKMNTSQSTIMDKLQQYAEGRGLKNIDVAGRTNAQLSDNAKRVRDFEVEKMKYDLDMRRNQMEQFGKIISGLTKGLANKMFDVPPSVKTPEQELTGGTQVMPEYTPAPRPDYQDTLQKLNAERDDANTPVLQDLIERSMLGLDLSN